ncbi:MAG: phenylalanine--tRNA ligase subunit alpha [Thermoguttaceae bacterium]|jgi:phenylalanyl-tRNA synthetase alpha chain|nr:phenylalanine--tRNA ligase subunit alpha [Thermoguttaceae bacterium]
MALAEFVAELDDLVREANAQFEAAADDAALEAARIEFLGAKSGRLKAVQKGLGGIDKADKPTAGKRFNEAKQQIDAAFGQAQQRLKQAARSGSATGQFDPTIPGIRPRLGRLHPITQTIEEMKDIMGRLGFTVAEGPEVEDPWHNFDALNIPADHPARDPLDNFYLATAGKGTAGAMCPPAVDLPAVPPPQDCPTCTPPSTADETPANLLLRSQTSTVQIRVMERTRPPVRIISVGRVYRPDTADDTHYPMFHQIEGLLVDRNVTMADLKSVLRLFASAFFKHAEVHIRFRPSFFPFTEPSVEVDMTWQGGWMEMGGAGMVDPNVLRAVGYDPDEVTGFAFGLGVERICMNRHGIHDIRELFRNDVRFLHQF